MRRALPVAALLSALSTATYAQSPAGSAFAWSGRAGLATGLDYRGIRLSDARAVPDLDLAVDHRSGAYLHGWLTRVDLPQQKPQGYYPPHPPAYPAPYPQAYPPAYSATESSMWQTLLDAGYRFALSDDWALGLAYGRYLYSGDTRQGSPGYGEVSLRLDYLAYLTAGYAHAEDPWGLDTRQDVLSAGLRWPFTRRLLGSATLGWVTQDGDYRGDYTYLRLDAGFLVRDWSFVLQYHDSFGGIDSYGDGTSSRQWIAQVNWHW